MKNKGVALLILGLAVLAIVAVLAVQTQQPARASTCSDCNVVIIAFDGLQAKHSSVFGYQKETMPNLEKFADESYVFTNTISASSWTVPSFMSIFTSAYPSDHKLVNKYERFNENEKVISNLQNMSPNIVTMAEMMKSMNYSTGGFTGDSGVSAKFGYGKGFDYYLDNKSFGGLDQSEGLAMDWIKNHTKDRFFVFLHGYDVHGQYDIENFSGRFLDSPYNGSFKGTKEEQGILREKGLAGEPLNLTEEDVRFWRAVYDEKIFNADERFAEFWGEIQKFGLDNNTIVIVLSDHGTEFYEHQRFDHGHALYDELINVPLIIHLPSKKGEVIEDQVRSIDVLPTIFELLNESIPDKTKIQIRGESLIPLMNGEHESLDAFSETDYRLYTHKRSLRTSDGWKIIKTFETGNIEIYNLNKDPKETKNLVNEKPKKTRELGQKLESFMRLTNQNEDKLLQLGCSPAYLDQCL